ncbi:hypothetical protein IQ07DRAFT_587290 [Pyrenochaeta sp. DS3sAY3a]|nr:hypothetical protein IQ07DRAFT_587290 [Pyrenochaeta sp. DS3sAY3a]
MVLQDANDSAPGSFGDGSPSSTNDPYASSSSSSGARFDPTNLPQPLPIIGIFMGFSDRAVRFKAETTLQFAERKIGRSITPEESQALAYHLYQLEQTKSYFAATGAAGGVWRWYNTWDKVRYPFYQPKVEDINPNKFWFVRGPMAQYARHAWRFSLYVVVAGQMGNVIGQLFAQPLAAINTSQDPKLEQFGIELKAAAQADAERNAMHGRDIQERRKEFQEQVRNRSGGGPSPQASWGRQAPRKSEEDDMSPTAGNEAWDSRSSASDSWESFSSDTSQSAPQRQQRPPSTEAWNRYPRPQQSSSTSSSPFDDDASPTGGLFQEEVNNPQPEPEAPSSSGGSSWDRLRRGGTPVPIERPRQQQSRRAAPEPTEKREGSSLGDSFTFVENEDERKRERERAQQEFDARLERERQGKDFNDEGKRW